VPEESRKDRLSRLADKARQQPKVPGVYLMKDDVGVVLYIGKALILPNRLSSYFQPSADLGPKKQPMLDLVTDFDTIECEGEWEALLTENRLIKDLHPKFNERLTDDKTYPYLVITRRDDFPGVYITRDPHHEDYRGAKVLGPFTSVYALRESIRLMQRAFQFRTCELNIQEDDSTRDRFRPCLLHAIKQCSAPCAAKVTRSAYRADIDRFTRFLESKRSVMLRELRQEMEGAAEAREYERAAALRDQMDAIGKLAERGRHSDGWQPEIEAFHVNPESGGPALQKVLGQEDPVRCIEAIDIAHLQGSHTVGAKVCFVDGRPCKSAYRRFKVRTSANDDYLAIREVVSRAYREAGSGQGLFPDVILIDGGLGQLSAATEAFAQLDIRPPRVISLAKKHEWIYVEGLSDPLKLGRDDPALKLCQAVRDEAHRFSNTYHALLRKKRMLGQDSGSK
jgi:excinuclease ABC subunit C